MAGLNTLQVTYLATDPGGWQTTYDGGFVDAVTGPAGSQHGVGDPARTTSTLSSSFEFQFYGRSVSVYGFVQGAIEIRLDSAVMSNYTLSFLDGAQVLIVNQLLLDWHAMAISLTKREDNSIARLSIQRVVFDTGLEQTNLHRIGAKDPEVSAWTISTGWRSGTTTNESNFNDLVPALTTSGRGERISMNLETGALAKRTPTALFVYGNLNSGNGRYKVTHKVDGDLEGYITWISTSESKYVVQRALLWFGINHFDGFNFEEITLTNAEARGCEMTSLEYSAVPRWPDSATVPKHHRRLTPIIAGSLIGALFAALSMLLLFLMWRRRKSKHQRASDLAGLVEILRLELVSSRLEPGTGSDQHLGETALDAPSDVEALPIATDADLHAPPAESSHSPDAVSISSSEQAPLLLTAEETDSRAMIESPFTEEERRARIESFLSVTEENAISNGSSVCLSAWSRDVSALSSFNKSQHAELGSSTFGVYDVSVKINARPPNSVQAANASSQCGDAALKALLYIIRDANESHTQGSAPSIKTLDSEFHPFLNSATYVNSPTFLFIIINPSAPAVTRDLFSRALVHLLKRSGFWEPRHPFMVPHETLPVEKNIKCRNDMHDIGLLCALYMQFTCTYPPHISPAVLLAVRDDTHRQIVCDWKEICDLLPTLRDVSKHCSAFPLDTSQNLESNYELAHLIDHYLGLSIAYVSDDDDELRAEHVNLYIRSCLLGINPHHPWDMNPPTFQYFREGLDRAGVALPSGSELREEIRLHWPAHITSTLDVTRKIKISFSDTSTSLSLREQFEQAKTDEVDVFLALLDWLHNTEDHTARLEQASDFVFAVTSLDTLQNDLDINVRFTRTDEEDAEKVIKISTCASTVAFRAHDQSLINIWRTRVKEATEEDEPLTAGFHLLCESTFNRQAVWDIL
ncbi:hypothetical protein BKA62DRAFT_710212 [Auriculariales sp. MPI-PUGE-AT-0066]|nr:hypothetical protein BKA62DRAFT_710212 [Auriculariales sp. MPI-PUGE-AT-0066]